MQVLMVQSQITAEGVSDVEAGVKQVSGVERVRAAPPVVGMLTLTGSYRLS